MIKNRRKLSFLQQYYTAGNHTPANGSIHNVEPPQQKAFYLSTYVDAMEIKIFGKTIDQQTRCEHYHGPTDVIAIKFNCCQQYYPCHSCHQESTTHAPKVWAKQDFDEKAILCGVCKEELTINEYLRSNNTCPHCKASFNPNCATHYGLYFELP